MEVASVFSAQASNEHSCESTIDRVFVAVLAEENAVLALERKDFMFKLGTARKTDEYLEQILMKQLHTETSSGAVFASWANNLLAASLTTISCRSRRLGAGRENTS